MLHRFFLIYIFFSSTSLFAQVTKADYFNTIDNKVYVFSKSHIQSPFDTITFFVNNTFKNSVDRARAYYTWIALNIKFDEDFRGSSSYFLIKDLRSKEIVSNRAVQAFESRMAASEGIADLMQKLCESSNIKCYTVAGYFKRPDNTISDMSFVWNVLCIDSSWVQLDASMANGYLNDNYKFIQYPMKNYFCLPAAEFIKDHFPHDPMWQLLNHPYDMQAFIRAKYDAAPSNINSYNDSLKLYEQKTLLQQQEIDIMRYFKYETNPDLMSRNVENYNYDKAADKMEIAIQYFDKYLEIGKNKLSKYPLTSDWKVAKNYLDKTEFYLKQVEVMSEKLTFISTDGDDVYKALRFNLRSNLEALQKNKDYMEKLKPFLKDK